MYVILLNKNINFYKKRLDMYIGYVWFLIFIKLI